MGGVLVSDESVWARFGEVLEGAEDGADREGVGAEGTWWWVRLLDLSV